MILAEFEINPNVIIVFVAMIIAGFKALMDKRAGQDPVEEEDTSEYEDLYEAYEAELEAQRQQLQIPVVTAPPPMPTPAPAPSPPKVNVPRLSTAEEEALKRLHARSISSSSQKSDLSTKNRIKAHLSSPTAAREALLLAEVFGPPKAFK